MTQTTSTQDIRSHSFIIRTVTTDTRDLFINRLVYTGRYPVGLEVANQTNTIRLSVTNWFSLVEALRDGDPVNEDQADAIQNMLFNHGYAE